MCPFYLDGEPTDALHTFLTTSVGLLPICGRRLLTSSAYTGSESSRCLSLAFVQFSSVVEDGRRVIPAPRSLRTEQRSCQVRGCVLARQKSRRHFRNAVLQLWLDGGL